VAGVPDQRRPDLEDGAVGAGQPGQDPPVPERVEQGPGEGATAGLILRGRRAGDLDARDQPGAADVPEAGVLAGQVAQPGPQVVSDGELDDAVVQVPGVGVEDGELAADRLDHRGVGVPDDGDVVVGVEVAGTVGGEQPRPFPADDVQRPGVEQRAERAAGDPAAAFKQAVRLRGEPAGAGEGLQAAGELIGAQVEELTENAARAGVVLADVGLVVRVRGRPAARDR
jgi:hypothetical protein